MTTTASDKEPTGDYPDCSQLIDEIDTLIAATALDRNLTLITSDADFQRVTQLRLTLLPPGMAVGERCGYGDPDCRPRGGGRRLLG